MEALRQLVTSAAFAPQHVTVAPFPITGYDPLLSTRCWVFPFDVLCHRCWVLVSPSVCGVDCTLVFLCTRFKENKFYGAVNNVFSLIFVMCFLYPSFRLIWSFVAEKELRIREGVKMMGMTDAALFSAWYLTYVRHGVLVCHNIVVLYGLVFCCVMFCCVVLCCGVCCVVVCC